MPWVTIDGAHILIGEPGGGQGATREEQIKDALAKRQVKKAGKEAKPKLTEKEKQDRLSKGKPLTGLSEKALRAQKHQNKTTGKVQTYTKQNEHDFAARIGGKAFPDNGPTDIETTMGGKTHGIEVKTVTHGKNDKITMKGDALQRKFDWEKANKSKMHTVILDHRDRFDNGSNAKLHSGNEIYYKRGLGSFRINSMHKVKDADELKQLMTMPYKQLPAAAQGAIRPHEIKARIT